MRPRSSGRGGEGGECEHEVGSSRVPLRVPRGATGHSVGREPVGAHRGRGTPPDAMRLASGGPGCVAAAAGAQPPAVAHPAHSIALQWLQEGRPGQEGRDEGEKEREQPPRARNPRPGSTGRVQLEPTLTLGCTAVRGAGRKRRRPHPNPRCNTQHAPHGRREGEQGWLRSKNTRRLAASCEVFKRKQAAHRTAGHARQQSARAHPKAGTDEQWPSNPQKTVAGR